MIQDDEKTAKENEKIAQKWLKEIDAVLESKEQKAFEKIGERIVKNYKNADALQLTNADKSSRVMLNVLWSNVQIQKPIMFCRLPKVVSERMFKDSDPIGRLAAEILERATYYSMKIQEDRIMYAVKSAVEDRLLPGRGNVWLRYTADFEPGPEIESEAEEGKESEPVEIIKQGTEKIVVDPVNWLDYLESKGRNQYEVRWRARRLHMSKADLIKEFGEDVAKKVKLGGNDRRSKMSEEEKEFLCQAEVYLIAAFHDKKFIWVSPDYKEGPLKIIEDPFRLKDFWPCPIPLLATTTTDSTYPTPDYKIYERLADEVDDTTKRLSSLVACIRLVGAAASQFTKDVKDMLALDDGQLWPIDAWATFVEKGGFKGIIDWLPFENAVAAIPTIMQYRDSLFSQINLITGIPDFAQGSTNPDETAEAQQRKSHWVNIKAQEKQADVQRFCREIAQKIAELLVEPGLFTDETICLMGGVAQMTPEKQELAPQAMALLRDDRLRTFRIDIETDSTIAIDEAQASQNWIQYMGAVKELFSGIEQIRQFRPEMVHPMIESALSAVRSLRTGRSVEGAWEKAMQEIEDNDKAQAEAAANQPPPPDIELMKVQNEQAKIQLDQAKMQSEQMAAGQETQGAQLDAQIKIRESQLKEFVETETLKLEQSKFQADYEIKSQSLQVEASQVMSKGQLEKLDSDLAAFKAQFTAQLEAKYLELERFKSTALIQEKMLEERRLAQDTQIEHIKLALEAKKVEATEKESKPPAIHIHNSSGSKEIRLKREPTGELVGRTKEINE